MWVWVSWIGETDSASVSRWSWFDDSVGISGVRAEKGIVRVVGKPVYGVGNTSTGRVRSVHFVRIVIIAREADVKANDTMITIRA
jgi:hypothetical protein